MEILNTIFRGFIIISLYALLQNFTITDMKSLAIKAHKKGPMSYSAYTRMLTQDSAKVKK